MTVPDTAGRVRRVIDAHPDLRDLTDDLKDSLVISLLAAFVGGEDWARIAGALDFADQLRPLTKRDS
jgi:hypothetical protein